MFYQLTRCSVVRGLYSILVSCGTVVIALSSRLDLLLSVTVTDAQLFLPVSRRLISVIFADAMVPLLE